MGGDHARGRVALGDGTQPGHRLLTIRRGDGGELGVLGAVVVQGLGHVGQAHRSRLRGLQPVREPAGQRGDPGGGLAGHDQRAHRRFRLRRNRFGLWSLLDHDVGVGAADTEPRHRGTPGAGQWGPLEGLRRDPELLRPLARLRGQLLEVQLLRDGAVVHGEHGLDKAGDTGRRLQMSEVGLHRTQHQRGRILAVAVHGRERVELDRVTQRGSGAVRLDVVDVGRFQPRGLQRLAHQLLLGRPVGHGLTAARTVLVDGRATDDGQHPVAVAQRVGEALEHDHARALAADISVGVGVERLALAVGSQHSPSRAGDVVVRGQDQVHPGGQRVVALAAAQALAGQVDGHQRRGARGVADHGRSPHSEEVGQPAGREVGRVAERDVGVDVLGPQLADDRVVVVVGRQPDEHTGRRAAQRARVDAGVLERLPGDLKQKTLLRVHRRGLARCDGEELGVELVGLPRGQEAALAVADGAGHAVVGGVVLVGVPPVGGHPNDATFAVTQQFPEVVGVVDATGQAATDADHGDRLGLGLLGHREPSGQIVDLAQGLGDDRAAIGCGRRRRGRLGHLTQLNLSESLASNSSSARSS